jgi:cobalt-zinc-cadmium efflux system membrane fusion protein
MQFVRSTILYLLALVLVLGLIFHRQIGERLGYVTKTVPADATAASHGIPNEQVKLTPQARHNLNLVSKPLTSQTFWRTIEVPGEVVDRPGISDRGVVAPVTGIVTKVHSFPGDTVQPGDVLFTLRLVSESLHTSQMELFKATRDVQITQEQRKRLGDIGKEGTIAQTRLIEVDNQLRRLEVVVREGPNETVATADRCPPK